MCMWHLQLHAPHGALELELGGADFFFSTLTATKRHILDSWLDIVQFDFILRRATPLIRQFCVMDRRGGTANAFHGDDTALPFSERRGRRASRNTFTSARLLERR